MNIHHVGLGIWLGDSEYCRPKQSFQYAKRLRESSCRLSDDSDAYTEKESIVKVPPEEGMLEALR